jgi:hypothetical protein
MYRYKKALAAKVKEAEEEALSAAAAAEALAARGTGDDDAGDGGAGGGGGGVLTAATVEANSVGAGGSLAEVKSLDLAMEGLGDVSALPRWGCTSCESSWTHSLKVPGFINPRTYQSGFLVYKTLICLK